MWNGKCGQFLKLGFTLLKCCYFYDIFLHVIVVCKNIVWEKVRKSEGSELAPWLLCLAHEPSSEEASMWGRVNNWVGDGGWLGGEMFLGESAQRSNQAANW